MAGASVSAHVDEVIRAAEQRDVHGDVGRSRHGVCVEEADRAKPVLGPVQQPAHNVVSAAQALAHDQRRSHQRPAAPGTTLPELHSQASAAHGDGRQQPKLRSNRDRTIGTEDRSRGECEQRAERAHLQRLNAAVDR